MFSLSVGACLWECPSLFLFGIIHLGHSFFVLNIIDDFLLDPRWFNEHIKTMKTTLGTANYEYLVSSHYLSVFHRCLVHSFQVSTMIAINVVLILSHRLSNNDSTLNFFFQRDQPCHLIEQEMFTSSKRIVSIKFSWRCVWMVRSSRINLSSSNVSSISNDKWSLLALTEHCLSRFNQCFLLASHLSLKSIN